MTVEIGTSELIEGWAASGDVVEPSPEKIDAGWEEGEQPPHEYLNYLHNQAAQKINHLIINGISEWLAATTYRANDYTKHSGKIYKAKASTTGSEPPSAFWELVYPINAKNSLVFNNGELKLENDESAPDGLKYYGTNEEGERGYHPFVNSGFTTGDYKASALSGPKDGFVRANGRTIGSSTSGATERANDDCELLFKALWDEDSSELAVSGGRGVDADSDWTANKTIALPDARGRIAAYLAGMGNTISTRLTSIDSTKIGAGGGAQEHTLTESEMPAHSHSLGANVVTETGSGTIGGASQAGNILITETQDAGGGAAHNNVQPTFIAGTLYIKL